MPATEKQIAWDRDNTVQIKLKLNKSTDADILSWLTEQPTKQGAIKDLIRKAITDNNQ